MGQNTTNTRTPLFSRIHATVRQIPSGKVSTYGRIASLTTGCTPRLVGYAMAALGPGSDVPWHRVINHRGAISLRSGNGALLQRDLLEAEGVVFDTDGKVDLRRYLWPGPARDHA